MVLPRQSNSVCLPEAVEHSEIRYSSRLFHFLVGSSPWQHMMIGTWKAE